MAEPQLTIEQQKIDIKQLKRKVIRLRIAMIFFIALSVFIGMNNMTMHENMNQLEENADIIVRLHNDKNHAFNECNEALSEKMLDNQMLQQSIEELMEKGKMK